MIRISTILLVVLSTFFSCKKENNSSTNNNNSNNSNNSNNTSSNHSIEHTFMPGKSGFDYNSPIVKGDFIYIGTSIKFFGNVEKDNAFYKFDLHLNKIWQYNLDTLEVRGSAALDASDNIYFTVQEGRKVGDGSQSKLYVYSLTNSGSFRWKKLIASGTEIKDVGAYELSVGAHVYVQGNEFYAFNKADGSEAWKVSQTGGVSKPIIDNSGNIYLVNFGKFICISPSGTLKWSFVPNDVFTEGGDAFSNASFATIDQSKIVFFYDTWLYNINSSDGSINWKYNAPHLGYQRGTPAIDPEGNIYVGRKNHNLASAFYKVKADGSGIIWDNKTFGEIYTCPVLANDSNVYFASELLNNGQGVEPGWNRIHCLNMMTGKVVWQADLGSDVGTSSPAIAHNGRIYAATIGYDGSPSKLVCIKSLATGPLSGAIRAQFYE